MLAYLVFGTAHRKPSAEDMPAADTGYRKAEGLKTRLDHPYQCYRVGMKPSLVEAAQLQEGEVRYIPLNPDSNQYKKVRKWVGQRNILLHPEARCIVTPRQLEQILRKQFANLRTK